MKNFKLAHTCLHVRTKGYKYKMNVECLVVLKPSSKRCSIRRVLVCLVQLRSFRVLCMPAPRVPHLSNP